METDVAHPVDQVEVQVIELEVLKGGLEGSGDLGGSVGVVPELRGDPDVVSRLSRLLEVALDSVSDLVLVLVDESGVDVGVAGLESND